MPSIETQNISTAAAPAIKAVEQPTVRQTGHTPTAQQVSQSAQQVLDRTTLTSREDRRRTTQIPKRTEAAFSPQKAKKEPDAAPAEADVEPKHANPDAEHVDIEA